MDKRTLKKTLGMHDRKCCICGKSFEATNDYVYKRRNKGKKETYSYFCSWKCLRKGE
ncbi:MAG: hypothetical protein J6Y78_15660 [Paludibacteraceae bacterium]|nr:hypothetical protein [Paludibacteraceae bacterium]